MADSPQPASLNLMVSAVVRRGENIEVRVDAVNVSETTVTLHAPDTVVISQPHVQFIGQGTFQRTVHWTVEHAQPGPLMWVEITVSAGTLTQIGQCKIIG
ncbi:MAG TPA: hypothetical protein VLJ17_08095 [Xanthobacteraceae bacterium]|nr:hypothetical protein [Xanthobacteraceae bacterium]